ncbi:MAG TPA: cytochrome c biogenesis heme-transporting ATPase CcmA [Spongiibacteraceae bacterium]|nr:cytochrome c biogenesis heme-transporting ATPase CcmA [Spongiibacteraceae bacterium]
MPEPLLEALELSLEHDERLLFEALSFRVAAGELLLVEGPNGSGKTSLLRFLAGLSSRSTGLLRWNGAPLDRVRPAFNAELRYLGHAAGIKALLSPRENLRFSARLLGADEAGIDAALARVGLAGFEDLACHQLSAGQQRRVALAKLFLGDSRLWILDEPFTAIDKRGVAEIETWLDDHLARGGSAIVTTHQALSLADRARRLVLGGMS